MSSIEKLSIRGIRSFSPNREEVVEFYHPLTVILGANGSGKTTIIECLKIACTGSLPPGARSGQSFIHDPRIAGTSEVKASVKLRIRNRAGNPMVVQRTFQLQNLKNGARFKALDGVIRVKNELGENVSMSHKCAELDRHIPEMLGVSKAILESVIFCHQEESNWPLLEGAVLKKRFDDIFESARYTKALDAIRKLKKARGDSAKDYKRDLAILSVKLKGAEEIRQKIEAAEVKLQEATEEVEQVDGIVAQAEETHDEMKHLLSEIEEEHSELDRLQADKARTERTMQVSHSKIRQFMSDSDEELEDLLKNYDGIIDDQCRAFKALEDQGSQLEREKDAAQEKYTELCTEKGKLESKIEAQHALVTELLDLASKAGTKYQFYPLPISSQDDDVKSFLEKFQHYVSGKTMALREAEKQVREGDDALNVTLSDLKAKLHHTKEQLKAKQRERGGLNAEKRQNAVRLKELSASPVPSARDITEAEKLVEEAEKALLTFKTQNNSLSLKEEISSLNKEIHGVDFDMRCDDDTIKVLRGSERDYIALEAKRQALRDKEDDFQEKLADKAAEYRTIVGDESPKDEAMVANTIDRLNDTLLERKEVLAEKMTNAKAAEQKLQENLASSKHVKKTLDDLRDESSALEDGPVGELKKCLDAISSGADVYKAEDIVQLAEKAYFTAKDKTERYKNTITFLKVFKEKGIKDKCCPLCARTMGTTDEELFIRTINEKTDDKKAKDKIEKAEAAEAAAFDKWKGAETNMPSWRKWMRVEKQIHTKSTELDTLYEKKRTLQSEAKDKMDQADEAQQMVVEVEEALRAYTALQSVIQELHQLRTKTAAEEERLRTQDAELLGTNAPSLASVQAARDEKQSRLHELNRQLQLKQVELQRTHDTQQQLQTDLHKKREEKTRVEGQRKEYEVAIEEQGRLREREKTLVDEMSALSGTEPQLETDIRAKSGEILRYRAETTATLELARQEEQQCQQELQSLQEKWRKAEAEASQQLDAELKRMSERIAQIKQKQIAATQALEDISPQLAAARKNLADGETFKRHIQDNLDYRNLKKELETIRAQIDEAKHKISTLPSLDDVSRRVQAANSAVVSAKEDRATLRGRQHELELQIREEKIKLRSSDYRNIEEKHRQKLIQCETTMMAVSDLDKYYKALDKSLLQFHMKKVEEINSIIKSLWQITYKGQDIDTIEVVSGQEMDTGGTKAARSYDYRVVMKKGGALIDMRGRCSAGQKVLAALVIRLALAETFCLNCGILALDEPTTNLDTENKYGLAQAITDILNARSEQENFQLVCITHDEEFVQMLSEAQSMDGRRPEYYWRVSREDIGNNRFCSKIERREWRDGI